MTDDPQLTIKVVGDDGEMTSPPEAMPSDQATTDASSIEDFQKKEDEQARKAREDRELFAALIGSTMGRRFLWGILEKLHPFETRFMSGNVGFPDANATFYELGQQQAGMALYQLWLTRHPAEVAAMHRENDLRLAPPVAPKKRRRSKETA